MSDIERKEVADIGQKIIAEVRGLLYNEQVERDDYNRMRSAPHILYGARVIQAAQGWFCILGDIPTGVVGFGKSPQEACEDFDRIWTQGEK